jgi:hypothetical protein
MGKIPGYQDGGYEDDSWDTEDDGQDKVGKNPTGRPRKSSAGQRRKKDRKLFGGTRWGKKDDGKDGKK